MATSGKGEEEERWTEVILSGGGGRTGLCKASRSFSPSGNTLGDQGRTSGTDGSASIGSVRETRVLHCCLLVKVFRTWGLDGEDNECRLCKNWLHADVK